MADLSQSKKVLMLMRDDAKEHGLLCIASMYKFLKSKNLKKLDIISSPKNPSISIMERLLPGVEILTDLPKKKFVLTVNNEGNEVDNVQWQQEENNLNIYISVDKGSINLGDLKFDTIGADYQTILLFGLSSLDASVKKVIDLNPELFLEAELFGVGEDLVLSDDFKHSSSNKPGTSTIAENTFILMAAESGNTPMPEDTVNMLYASILLETENLTSKLKSPDIFSNLRKLYDQKVNLERVQKFLKIVK